MAAEYLRAGDGTRGSTRHGVTLGERGDILVDDPQ
jgi:hypothetical protein